MRSFCFIYIFPRRTCFKLILAFVNYESVCQLQWCNCCKYNQHTNGLTLTCHEFVAYLVALCANQPHKVSSILNVIISKVNFVIHARDPVIKISHLMFYPKHKLVCNHEFFFKPYMLHSSCHSGKGNNWSGVVQLLSNLLLVIMSLFIFLAKSTCHGCKIMPPQFH